MSLIQRILQGIAPAHCQLCGLPSHRSIALCRACDAALPRNRCRCLLCALPLVGHGLVCGHCQHRPPPARISVAPCLYTEPVDGMIKALKYRGDFSQLAVLSHLMLGSVVQRLESSVPPDYLVPMPLHWWRRWRRGFNQAEVLAQSLCHHPELQPWTLKIDKGLCVRQRATRAQAELNARERVENLHGALLCRKQLEGQRIAIVDDVVTTGASAWTLASELYAAGAGDVEIWCCARTPQAPEQVH